MNGRELTLENTFAVAKESTFAANAQLVSSLTDSWFSEAAGLVNTSSDFRASQPLSAKPYDTSQGFGYATWHHGSELLTICYGQPDVLIAKADLTDTERESLLLKARQRITAGSQVLAIAHISTAIQPSESDIAHETALTLDGCLAIAYKNRV